MSSGAPLVTIAIPTYNRAHTYLRPCLEGVLRQTYARVEVIVADNASADHTAALVRAYGDPRVRYYRHPQNIGPNPNFNFCLEQARGVYFMLLQDDEQIDHDFVEAAIAAVGGRRDVGLIHTGLRAINAEGRVIEHAPNLADGLSLGEFFLAWFDGRVRLYLCNTLFNRAALVDIGGLHSRHDLFQDVMAQVKIAARRPRAAVPAIKATTRQHGDQRTHTATVQAWCEDSLDLLELMCRTVPAHEGRIQAAGQRFFARIGHSRASAVAAPLERLRAHARVYRMFGHLPTWRLALSGTTLYRSLRRVKRRILGRPAWVD